MPEGAEPGTAPEENGDITFEVGFAPQNGAVYADADERGAPQMRGAATAADFSCAWKDGDAITVKEIITSPTC